MTDNKRRHPEPTRQGSGGSFAPVELERDEEKERALRFASGANPDAEAAARLVVGLAVLLMVLVVIRILL